MRGVRGRPVTDGPMCSVGKEKRARPSGAVENEIRSEEGGMRYDGMRVVCGWYAIRGGGGGRNLYYDGIMYVLYERCRE